jgi:hypothetical protein
MFMRTSDKIAGVGLLCLALAGCDNNGSMQAAGTGSGRAAVADCAIGSRSGWARTCLVEQAGAILTLRHADGGFRRFTILKDGRGLASADGAEPASIAILEQGQIEVSAGEDRYRLPATIAGR